ncbi:MAG: TIGR03905 family TSCPD domain-containing protein [Eubacteriales bacterium]
MKEFTYTTKGTCSRAIEVEVDDNSVITSVRFIGGCSGNTQGVAALVKGMTVEEAIARLEGIKCGLRPTSCPDQLAKALKQNAL